MNHPAPSPGPAIRPAIAALEGSLIREIAEANIGRDDVIALWFGEPDEPTPQFIKDAATAALAADKVFYTQNRGIPELRAALARYATGLHGRPLDVDRVTVTCSGMNALMLVSQALVEPGDNVVVVVPMWPNFRMTVAIMGGEARLVSLAPDAAGRWQLDLDRLFAACDGRTKAVFVNSPGNPTGWTMPAAQQAALLAEARRRGLWVVSDEVYVRLAYEAPRAPSFLDLAAPDDRVVVVNSFSKSWSMTGWRLGWLTHPAALGEAFSKLNEFNVAAPAAFVQHAGVVAVEQGEPLVAAMVERYRHNRDLVFQRLAGMRRVRLARPEGAFYAFFRLDGMTDSVATAKALIERAGVGLAPGLAFGPAGEGWLRLCFAARAQTLSAALDRLQPEFD
ncbi:MAG: aminotransferase class I/II-fold pyridoxal phosphate-dependent enzyme [Alphaproteobacteria bacterium]|nr:aminotransferase class I/II-fold pyridoxal phosphate-dependent enzyme [Alphaproteobacteria bacterium]